MHVRHAFTLPLAVAFLAGCSGQREASSPAGTTTSTAVSGSSTKPSPEFCLDLPTFNDRVVSYMVHIGGQIEGDELNFEILRPLATDVASLGEKMMPTVPADLVTQFRTVRQAIAKSAAGLKPDWKTGEVVDPLYSAEMRPSWEAVQLYKGC